MSTPRERTVEVAPFALAAGDDASGAALETGVEADASLDAAAGAELEAAALLAADRSAGKAKGAFTLMLMEPSGLMTSGF